MNAPEVDVILVAEELPIEEGVERRLSNLLALGDAAGRAAALGKPLVMFTPLHVGTTDYGRRIRARLADLPVLRGTERTLRVMAAVAAAATRPIYSGTFLPPPPSDRSASPWRARASALAGPRALNEVESKLLLGAYGIALPAERLVLGADDAVRAAQQVGFPVVLKAVSAALPHKSDAGLVMLNLRDADAVKKAVATITARASALPVALDGILVARQMTGGVETVIGIQRDVEMGPVVMFGLGGIWVELFKDVSFAPAFLDREHAVQMIATTKAGRLLEGLRGGRPGDLAALCHALVNLGRLACDLGDIVEAIDVNPFLVCEAGAFALDALVVLRPPSSADGIVPEDRP
jgi:acetyltransferase